jgi:hypothetical protein
MEVPVGHQSSTVTVFRAFVMLVCLIAIPLAALFGSSLPGMVKALQEGRWPLVKVSVPPRPLEEAPPFVRNGTPAQGLALGNPPASRDARDLRVASDTLLAPACLPGVNPDERGNSGVVPARYDISIPPVTVTMLDTLLAATSSGLSETPADTANKLTPVTSAMASLVPVQRDADDRPGEPPTKPPATERGSTNGEAFNVVHDRLRQLGATYYLLESWGGQQQLYRFYCKMAVGGNSNYTRYFEAIDSDPLRAMSQVLQQVESWRSGRM